MENNSTPQWTNEQEALYQVLTSALEEVPNYQDRALVLLNVVRHVIQLQAQRVADKRGMDLGRVFGYLCREWSMDIYRMPALLASDETSVEVPCGKCPACISNQINALTYKNAAKRDCAN